MNKPILLTVYMCMVVISLTACATAKPMAGPWRARVVDAESTKPIEGAAVVAVWYEWHPAFPESRTDYLDASETKTDKDGMFVISPRGPIPRHPMGEVEGPYFTIYKPGYNFFSGSHVITEDNRELNIGSEPITISLKQLFDANSRRNSAAMAKGGLSSVPDGKKKYLLELYRSELNTLGLPVK